MMMQVSSNDRIYIIFETQLLYSHLKDNCIRQLLRLSQWAMVYKEVAGVTNSITKEDGREGTILEQRFCILIKLTWY